MSDTQLAPKKQFAATVGAIAERELVNLFGTDAGKQAAARVALAFRAASATAKNPDAFYKCSAESVASAMATSAFTMIMPGGPFTGCYLIPKGGAIQWWINHRGIKTLARRAGQSVETIPYFDGDTVTVTRGREYGLEIAEDGPDRDSYAALAGIVVMVRSIDTGMVLSIRKVTKAQIEKRRMSSDQANAGPWKSWPLEMAEKTAIKFAAGRGDIFFDDVGNIALSRDAETVIDTTATDVPAEPRPTGKAALGLSPETVEVSAEVVAEESPAAEPTTDDDLARLVKLGWSAADVEWMSAEARAKVLHEGLGAKLHRVVEDGSVVAREVK